MDDDVARIVNLRATLGAAAVEATDSAGKKDDVEEEKSPSDKKEEEASSPNNNSNAEILNKRFDIVELLGRVSSPV